MPLHAIAYFNGMSTPQTPQKLRHTIFWPVFGLFLIFSVLALAQPSVFTQHISALNQGMLSIFGSAFSISALSFLALVFLIYLSPLAHKKLGGPEAKPLLPKAQWIFITICTTIASGLLFWAAAEPLYHYHSPLADIEAASPQAFTFALSTLYIHWSFIPYGIYTLVALIFAWRYYNEQKKYSISALFGHNRSDADNLLSKSLDGISLFSLVAGMSASLGAGILLLSGGLSQWGLQLKPTILYALVALCIVGAFVASSISGLMRGIRWLSDVNAKLFFFLGLFILLTGPTLELLPQMSLAIKDFFIHFFEKSTVGISDPLNRAWANDWTIFYWTNWLAWTPITALFLGRIAYGYTVRTFIHVNLVIPSLFAIVWLTLFGGGSILADQTMNGALYQLLSNGANAGQVSFELLKHYPLSALSGLFFFLSVYISFVTAADSNTTAMSALSSEGISPASPEAPFRIKIAWGLLIGMVTWIMISFSGEGAGKGLDGIRILSNLGGLPALFIAYAAAYYALKLLWKAHAKKL